MGSARWDSTEISLLRFVRSQRNLTRYKNILLLLLFPTQIFTTLSSSQTSITAGKKGLCMDLRHACGSGEPGLTKFESNSLNPVQRSPWRRNPLRLRGGRKKDK
eukprot:2728885-Rhodomonas_salina.1